MSPEQVSGTQVDGRSDLFSLGVVFYELLSGTKPFRGDSINAIMYAINHNDHIPLAESTPDGPECCSAIINRLLAKQADDRFSNAGELLEAIKACRASLDEAAPRIDAPSETIIE
jgi:serine/threonine-protein kinase